jgi:hypothetical protein
MSVERRTPLAAGHRTAVALAAVAVALTAPAAVLAADAAGSGRSAAAGPIVQTMVVGSSGSALSAVRTVSAAGTTVRVGRRTCAIAAGTPLAVLAADRRAGGPGFALRDYGRCGSAAGSSAELFVYSLGGERNSGQNGWEYKVDQRAGSTGAADPSGARGDGRRLHSGQRVLWFWCHASGAGCQRTLALSPASAKVSAAGSLVVTVTGYDNEGRAAPVAGAIVTLGSNFASTDAHGHATLVAPAARGVYAIAASRRGLVPSFPETIVVG